MGTRQIWGHFDASNGYASIWVILTRLMGTCPNRATSGQTNKHTISMTCLFQSDLNRGLAHENNEKDGGHDDSTEAHAADDDSDDSLAGNA